MAVIDLMIQWQQYIMLTFKPCALWVKIEAVYADGSYHSPEASPFNG